MTQDYKYQYGSADWSCFSEEFGQERKWNPWLDSLNYYTLAYASADISEEDDQEVAFLAAIYKKLLFRGVRTYLQPEVEERLFQFFPEDLRPARNLDDLQNIRYRTPSGLTSTYYKICSLSAPHALSGLQSHNPFDPENPGNEFKLYQQLIEVAGERIAGYVYPQCPLDQILPESVSRSFLSQRLDFLIVLPNGRGVILEPGNHGQAQAARNQARTQACRKHLGYETIRIENEAIGSEETDALLRAALADIKAEKFLRAPSQLEENLIAPFAVHRIESALSELLLERKLLQEESLNLAIKMDKAGLAAIGIFSFLKRLEALMKLYDLTEPGLRRLQIAYICPDGVSEPMIPVECLEAFEGLRFFKVQIVVDADRSEVYDAFIDLSLRHGTIKPLDDVVQAKRTLCIRNSFPHRHRPTFVSGAKAIKINPEKLEVFYLDPFVQECFRLRGLRADQVRILKSLFTTGDTIGLLPTGGGKSLCYQLAGLLKIGVTLVVDPLIALMDDQAASLKSRSRITHVEALHSGKGDSEEQKIKTEEIFDLFVSTLFVFISPERFLRQDFRIALLFATNSGARVSLAVIDEAHC
ncbi:MAG: DEAD/DEAH box helicase, partial [Verrucomicrobia bacterium]|nr:DEAD/DEAH box helicase [Verrucomicrobiota bacterium]